MLRSRTASLGRQLLQGISVTDAAGAQRFKQTTGIVGLDVVPNSRSVLQERCQEVLKAVAVIPEHAEYRRVVEATVNKQIKSTSSAASDEDIEQEYGFQLEQMIEFCKDELRLIPKVAEWKPWDVPPGHQVEFLVEEDVPQDEALPKRVTERE